MNTMLENAQRLIKAATGETYGDGMTVTDLIVGYAEPGYGTDESVIVLGDYNDHKRYVDGQWVGRTGTKADTVPSRLGDALERIGVKCEWSDDWASCGECYRALRTQGDSYGWTMYGAFTADGHTCRDCMKRDPNAYLTEGLDYEGEGSYINNPRNAVTWLTASELKAIGFVKWEPGNEHDYESGWHPGQTDDPTAILASIQETGQWEETVFLVDSVGQFDIHFSAWVRNPQDAETSEDD